MRVCVRGVMKSVSLGCRYDELSGDGRMLPSSVKRAYVYY